MCAYLGGPAHHKRAVVPAGTGAKGLPWIARLGGRRVGVLVADIA
jgi:hypothetical protein